MHVECIYNGLCINSIKKTYMEQEWTRLARPVKLKPLPIRIFLLFLLLTCSIPARWAAWLFFSQVDKIMKHLWQYLWDRNRELVHGWRVTERRVDEYGSRVVRVDGVVRVDRDSRSPSSYTSQSNLQSTWTRWSNLNDCFSQSFKLITFRFGVGRWVGGAVIMGKYIAACTFK